MATTTSIPIPSPSLELLNDLASHVTTGIDHNDVGASPEQNRSSSLSDIGDHGDENMADPERSLSVTESDPNDTEAETERLEDSPYKSRATQNLVLADPKPIYDVAVGTRARIDSVERASARQSRHGSEDASSRASSLENNHSGNLLNRPKKRKRPSLDIQYLNDPKSTRESIAGDAVKPKYLASSPESSPQPANRSEKWNLSGESSQGEDQASERDTKALPEGVKVKGRRSKENLGKASEILVRRRCPTPAETYRSNEHIPDGGAPDANPDDVEMEDSGEYGGFDSINKDEEASELALLELNRLGGSADRLFDERLAKLDTELAMLAEPNVTHPELLGMNQVLEQRRDEKIRYENTLLKYKLGSLENKSKAEKAQVHGQYMQSVRDIRDWNVEQVNKEWYQIHKERFGRENNVPEYMYLFPTRRSQQITQQTAYNKEVSLLSGVAKYRGFPAAPEICGAKPSEIESDFEKMGIAVQQPSAAGARQPPSLRASLSATAVLQRSKAVADEHFLEQNPWANPQHAAHLHRQASGLSRTASPLACTAMQKRPLDSATGMRPTPTPAGAPSGPGSAVGAATDHPQLEIRMNKQRLIPDTSDAVSLSTLSKEVPVAKESQRGRLQKNKATSLSGPERAHGSVAGRTPGQEILGRPYMPRQPFKGNSPSSASASVSASKAPVSPPNRFPMIKAENMARLSGRSPPTQQYQQPVQVAVNGGIDRVRAS
ncbi:MAG: hypothetical protein Q9205_004323 [Flavoplaca limonia]